MKNDKDNALVGAAIRRAQANILPLCQEMRTAAQALLVQTTELPPEQAALLMGYIDELQRRCEMLGETINIE